MDGIDYEMYSSTELLEAEVHSRIYHHSHIIKPMVLRCAIELGVPDLMQNHGKPFTLSELVASLHIHPTKTHFLYRLLRILVHMGFFAKHQRRRGEEEEEEEKYSLTLAFRLLPKERWPTKSIPISVSNTPQDSLLLNLMLSLSTWFKNSDKTVLETARRKTVWDMASGDKGLNSSFNEMMARDSRLIATVMLRECKEVFEGVKSLVDVGGGTGTMAKAIANAFPHIKCTVLDLPHVIAGLQGPQNLAFLAGDMFEAIPPANAVLLKWILHDWNHEDCVRILKRCKEAIPRKEEGGKVMIIEMVIEEDQMDKDSYEAQLYLDMVMMVMQSGQERNQMEWEKIFFAAGFSNYKITPAFGDRSLIELYP
ncbi:hypothetical protein FNV43_RR12881 [Rhamnella rubrinervis]|uniref:Uncharacterized protein n=1 Tax=Rhamnella rubrinervis TaxID=2594499 RepID=A0A8K0H039_9ROSA|nr:hypothetical protein FNV43_RR12881 [Rhamnella rubrinervis]